MLPTPSFYVKQEQKRNRAAAKLVAENDGDFLAAANVAWERMESETNGTKANFWGAVCLEVQKLSGAND